MPSKEDLPIELQNRLQSLQDQLAAIAEDTQDSLKANALLDLAKAEIEAEEFEAASTHLQESLSLQAADSTEKAAVHTELCAAYLGLSKMEEAENEINAAISIHQLQGEKAALNKAIRQLALIFAQKGKMEEAEQLIHQKIEQTTAVEDWEEAGKFYGFAGELASAQEDYQVAFEYFRSGLKSLRKTEGNHDLMGGYYESLARLLMHFQKNAEAAHSFEEGAAQYELANKPLLQGGLLTLVAKVWESEGKYMHAIPYLERAATAFQQSEEQSAAMQTADAYYQIAYLYEQEKQFAEALKYHQKALPFAHKTEDEMLIASVEDSIEQCQEKLQSQKPSKAKDGKKGFFGKLKDMFG
ncbi:MAG: hypothetical protein R3E32_23665 [Chitinophagales bacterium]